MATGTAGKSARELGFQAVHYFRKTVNYNDVGISTGVKMGTLPIGAEVVDAIAKVKTAFNAATTNVLTCGTNSSSYDNILGASDITEGTPGVYRAPVAGLIADGNTVGDDIYVKYTQSGTAATTGKAVIMVMYVPNNDQ